MANACRCIIHVICVRVYCNNIFDMIILYIRMYVYIYMCSSTRKIVRNPKNPHHPAGTKADEDELAEAPVRETSRTPEIEDAHRGEEVKAVILRCLTACVPEMYEEQEWGNLGFFISPATGRMNPYHQEPSNQPSESKFSVSGSRITPPKTNMEPNNGPLEKEIPFENHHFQVPAVSFQGFRIWW